MPRPKGSKNRAEPDPYYIPDTSKGKKDIATYDEELIERLANHGCTVYEIAHICGFSESHFHELKKKYPDIQAAIDRGKANLHRSLRQKQVEVALEGNPQMLIFLGKAELGQTDRVEINQNIVAEVEYEIKFGNPTEKSNNKATESASSTDDSSE
jgi:hypothetical protein